MLPALPCIHLKGRRQTLSWRPRKGIWSTRIMSMLQESREHTRPDPHPLPPFVCAHHCTIFDCVDHDPQDMRTAGFVGLAGEVIVSALPARPPTAKQPRRRTARSMTRRDLSKALSFRSTARSSAASTTTTTTTTTLATNGTALVVAKEDTARSRVAAAPPLLGSISLVSTIGNPSGADHLDEDTNANMGDTVAADRRHARVEYNASLSPTRRRCRPSIAAPTRGGGGALGGGRGNESRGGARLGGIPVWRAGAGNRGAAVDSAFGSMTGGIAGHENWSWGTSRRAFSLR